MRAHFTSTGPVGIAPSSCLSGGLAGIALAVAGLAVLAGPAFAQASYPSGPIRMVIPYGAGGATDVQGRLVAESLSRQFGQPVVVENLVGASGTTGSAAVARSAPDGYTIVMGSSASHSVNTIVLAPLPYDPIEDFAPIGLATVIPNVVVVPADHPADSVASLLEHLRAHPGEPFGTAGPASSGRFAGELLQAVAGVELTNIPYQTAAETVLDLVGGHIQLGIVDIVPVTPQVISGALRAIAVTTLDRSSALPDVPTLAESGLDGFEAAAWLAFYAPAGTPPEIVDTLNQAIGRALQEDGIRTAIEAPGAVISWGTPEDLRAFNSADIAKWQEIAELNGLTFD